MTNQDEYEAQQKFDAKIAVFVTVLMGAALGTLIASISCAIGAYWLHAFPYEPNVRLVGAVTVPLTVIIGLVLGHRADKKFAREMEVIAG